MSAVLAEPLPHAGRPGGDLQLAVLVLDDSEVDRMKMRRLIEEAELASELVEVDTLEAMEAALKSKAFDVVLIDFYLVGETGFEALELLAQMPGRMPVPIMITGDEQTEIAVQAIKMGCIDYLPKARLSADRLKAVIREVEAVRHDLPMSEAGRHQAMKALPGRMVSRASNAVRPELARIVRELREVKSDLEEVAKSPPHLLQDIERRYGELWGKLRDPETYEGGSH